MKNILNKIEFHYTYIIMAFGLVITGHFVNLIIFTSLIIIHEMGHIIISKILSYKIDKVIIYPYGGFVKLNTKINTKIENDLLVAISGIIMQSIYFGIIFFLYRNGIVREYIYSLFLLYHKSMLIFNLLPIYPLDGAKIVNLILSKYFSFNIANYISIVISLITVVFFLYSDIYENNYSIILVIGVLMQNIYKFYKDISYIYNRFILERYLFKFNYKDKKVIKNINKMYKNREHLFNDKGKLINEKEYISTFFEKKP
jgi:stage IV sporulation protein FB